MTEAAFVDGEVLFALVLDFDPGTGDPGRVFRAMAELIDAFHRLDIELARSVAVEIRPIQVLHDIESGSLITWLRTMVEQVDDDALKNLDWKPLVGQYLVRGKHRLLEWMDGREQLASVEELEPLEQELLELAEQTDVLTFPSYAVVPRRSLLEALQRLSNALSELRDDEEVRYRSPFGETALESSFHLSSAEIEELLTAETRTGEFELDLLVKKADYLGQSMWEFRYANAAVEGRILDDEWLTRFRAREIDIRPGDALRALVRVELKTGSDGSLVAVRYHVLNVREVLRNFTGTTGSPLSLFESSSEARKAKRPLLQPGSEDEAEEGSKKNGG